MDPGFRIKERLYVKIYSFTWNSCEVCVNPDEIQLKHLLLKDMLFGSICIVVAIFVELGLYYLL
jgi:hypothetical protein